MDADDLRDFEDQCPQAPPRSTANVGPYARFLANMPDWTDMSQETFNKAFLALPIPMEGPPPPGRSIHEAIQVSFSYIISYLISRLIYVA